MWVNAMQEAFVAGAVKAVGKQGAGKAVDRVIRVANKVRPQAPREDIKLSFRTAQRLKRDGVIG